MGGGKARRGQKWAKSKQYKTRQDNTNQTTLHDASTGIGIGIGIGIRDRDRDKG